MAVQCFFFLLLLAFNLIFMCVLQKMSLRLHSPVRRKAAQSWCGYRSKWEWLSCVSAKWFWLTCGAFYLQLQLILDTLKYGNVFNKRTSIYFCIQVKKLRPAVVMMARNCILLLEGMEHHGGLWCAVSLAGVILSSLHLFHSGRQFSQPLINWETNKLHHYELIFNYYQARAKLRKSCSW